jgi:hypothetical protein
MPGSAVAMTHPPSSEYAPYYERYTSLVPQGDIVTILTKQLEETIPLLRGINEAKAGYRYAPDKWSIKQLLGHINDGERVFSYRALRFARNDSQPLTGFEQDDYVQAGDFDERAFADLVNEFEHVRRATIDLLRPLSDEAWLRRGVANDAEISVRALAFIMAGHVAHHVQILKERYLAAAGE